MAQQPTITASTTDFLLNTASAANVGTDNFILQVTGFSANGVPVSVPGLGTSFGLYIEGTVTVQGTPSVYGPGSIALVLDPTNNDGTPSATWDPATQSGSIGFSNLVNTADDITLATGNWVSGSFGTQSNGQPGVNFAQTFNLNPALFGPHAAGGLDIDEALFNTATSKMNGTTTANGTWITSNDGFGIVDLTQASVTGSSSPSFLSAASASKILAELGTLASSGGSQSVDIRAIADEVLTAFGVDLPGSFLSGGHGRPYDFTSNSPCLGGYYHPDAGSGWSSNLVSHNSHAMRY